MNSELAAPCTCVVADLALTYQRALHDIAYNSPMSSKDAIVRHAQAALDSNEKRQRSLDETFVRDNLDLVARALEYHWDVAGEDVMPEGFWPGIAEGVLEALVRGEGPGIARAA